METPPSVGPPFFSLVPLYALYPIRAYFRIKGSQRRWREQAMGMNIPLIAVVSGEFAAIRAFPPTQAAVRKQEFGQPDPTVSSGLEFVEPLGGPLVQGIPGPISRTFAYPPRGDQMAKIMKEVKRYGWRSDMRDIGALIQLAVGNELHPECYWIVIKADEPDIALIERRLVESVPTGKLHSLPLHAAPQHFREIAVFPEEIALRGNAYLIVNVE